MITCHKANLFARCAERGYRVAEVLPCVVAMNGDEWTIDETHPAYPSTPKPPLAPGLGDLVAAGLDAVGITKSRVQAVASAVGIKDCGCRGRQAAMNAAGAKYLGLSPGSTAPENKG